MHDKSLMVMRKYQPHAKNIKPFLDEVLEWLKDCCEKANQDTNYQPIFIIDETFDTATEVDIKTVLNSYLVSNCHYIGDEIALHEFYFRRADFGHLAYYIKENTDTNPKYRRIPFFLNDQWETLPENEINQLTLVRDGMDSNRFFDPSNRIAFEIQLKEVINFPNVFLYNPNDLKAEEGDFQFNYLDHEGYDSSAPDWALRVLIDPFYKNIKDYNDRNVAFSKNKKEGLVNLLPKLYTNWGKYIIRYTYYEKGTKHNSFFGTRAIKLKFRFYGAFLEYLNQTIFYHFDDVSLFSSNNRQFFLEDYTDILYSLLRQAKNDERIKILYYVPLGLFEKINPKFLWLVLDETLKGFVTNTGTNTEDIVLHILKGLSKSTSNIEFLDELLLNNRILNLIKSVDGENFETLMQLFWSKWKNSTFANIDQEKNKIITENSPVFLDYRSDKTMGFHHDKAEITWNESKNKIAVKITKGTGVFETYTVAYGQGGYTTKTTEITETFEYSYHPFSPIVIFSADNPHFIMKENNEDGEPYQLMPAFVLYANDEKTFWENWLKAGEYAFDIITTYSGVLNILKFGRLYKVLQAGKSLTGKGRIFTKAVTGAKGVSGVAEISSGSVNILLKLTGIADTELGREISKYLFYFEMAALSGEVSLALFSKLKASASKILAKEKVLREAAEKTAKNADEVEQVELLLRELKIIVNQVDKIVYEPLRFNKLYSISAAALDTALNVSKNIFFYLKNLTRANTETVFYKGVEIFTDSPAKVKVFLDEAAKVLKAKGVKGVEEFFENTGTILSKKRLHSQTGETFICNLIRKKEMNKYYYYEIEDFQYGIKNWNRNETLRSERFECFVTLADKPSVSETIGKNILYADLYVPKSLNDTFQANKLDLTDISLGKTMLDDGYAVLKKDLGKDLDGIYGEWLNNPGYKDFGGESVNLTKLKEAMGKQKITKENLEIAAMETVTGKWAASKGFTKAKVVSDPGVYDELNENINLLKELEVIFIK